MSPMPYSVFFHGGYAIHGTNAVQPPGHAGLAWLRAAAHGQCATFYSLVQEFGPGNTRIIVTN